MYLAPASFNPQLIKGEILQYYKGLIASIKNNHVLVEQSFHGVPLEDKDNKQCTLQSGDFVFWKRHLQKNSSTSLERFLSGTLNQPLYCHSKE